MNWLRFGTASQTDKNRLPADVSESHSAALDRLTENRRSDGRLVTAGRRNGLLRQDWILVNFSPNGLAIRVWGRAPFARAEKYVISIRSGALWAEVEGQVRWTLSSWHPDRPGAGRQSYCQTAGFEVCEGLSAEQTLRWVRLQDLAARGSVQLDIGLVTQHRRTRRDGVVVPFRLRAAAS
jgi:hypothetical protein